MKKLLRNVNGGGGTPSKKLRGKLRGYEDKKISGQASLRHPELFPPLGEGKGEGKKLDCFAHVTIADELCPKSGWEVASLSS